MLRDLDEVLFSELTMEEHKEKSDPHGFGVLFMQCRASNGCSSFPGLLQIGLLILDVAEKKPFQTRKSATIVQLSLKSAGGAGMVAES